MPTRILVTGSSGFVGGHLCQALSQAYPDARLVRLGLKSGKALHDATVCVDLLDHASVFDVIEAEQPDLVIHLAAQASVGSINTAAAESTWLTNVAGSLNVALGIAKFAPTATVLFASSSEVYGRSLIESPVTETSPIVPISAYAKSKSIAEQTFCNVLAPEARVIMARPFNHTGFGQREDFVLASFAGQIARIEAGSQEPIIRVGDLEVARDFLDVRDVVDAYLALLRASADLPARFVVNVASGKAHKLLDLLNTLRDMARVPFQIDVDPSRLRPLDIPVAFGDASLLRRTTGWSPKIAVTTMLRDLLDAARASVHEHA